MISRLPGVLAWSLLLFFSTNAAVAESFYVKASRLAVVRDKPSTDARALERLERGDERQAFNEDGNPLQTNSFYKIRLSDGNIGWVSRYVVRAHRGMVNSDLDEVSSPETTTKNHIGIIGVPKSEVLLENEGYLIGYDPRLKIASWVQYRLTPEMFGSLPKANSFRPDTRLPEHQRSDLDDYKTKPINDLWEDLSLMRDGTTSKSLIYAKGHLVPDASQNRDEDLQGDTYFLSNMAPQVQDGFNSGTWSSLEREIRQWCDSRGELYVIAGPVFLSADRVIGPRKTTPERITILDQPMVKSPDPLVLAQPPTERQMIYNVIGDNEVAVPSAFFCIVADITEPEKPEALAFIMYNSRQTIDLGRTLKKTLTSIDQIEDLTGLDFLSELPDPIENRVRSEERRVGKECRSRWSPYH